MTIICTDYRHSPNIRKSPPQYYKYPQSTAYSDLIGGRLKEATVHIVPTTWLRQIISDIEYAGENHLFPL